MSQPTTNDSLGQNKELAIGQSHFEKRRGQFNKADTWLEPSREEKGRTAKADPKVERRWRIKSYQFDLGGRQAQDKVDEHCWGPMLHKEWKGLK